MEIKDIAEENYPFWKNIILLCLFFIITPIALGTSIFSLFTYTQSKKSERPPSSSLNLIEAPKSGVKVYASLPSSSSIVYSNLKIGDARAELIRQYLGRFNSPLVAYAPFIVSTSDKYGVDYRLTTAIAQQESNLCRIFPYKTYNCWGWGITSKGTLGFSSFEEGIDAVTKGIKENYVDEGYLTIEDIMGKYTPLSNGSWAAGVTLFMQQIEEGL